MRRSDRHLDAADALTAGFLVEAGRELRVTIRDEELGFSTERSAGTKLRLRACWVTHSPAGFDGIPFECTRRVSISIENRKERRRGSTVSTVKKLHAAAGRPDCRCECVHRRRTRSRCKRSRVPG
jgi:hypothetical protein